MDLDTENAIARLLMKEAAELRRQAEREGVHAYLRKPNVRARPNSRFLTATVLGVQQSNRLVEANEMWRVREKEKELDDRIRGRSSDDSSSSRSHRDRGDPLRSTNKRHDRDEAIGSGRCSPSKKDMGESCSGEEVGLKDDEIDEFLHSRAKRGRGAVGSRMDETGPYLPATSLDSKGKHLETTDVGDDQRWERKVVLGPEKPRSLKPSDSSDSESSEDEESRRVKRKKSDKISSSKRHSRKHKSKDKKKHKDRKRKEKREKLHK